MRRRVIPAVLLACFGMVLPGRAFASDPGPVATGQAGPSGPVVSAGNGGAPPVSSGGGPGGGGGSSGPSCAYIASSVDEYGPPSVWDPNRGPNGQPGQWYDVYCGGVFTQTVFVAAGAGGPGGLVVSPVQLAQRALASAPFKPLTIVMSPPAGREAVNFPIFLSLQGYTSVSASASAGGVTSTVSIVPGSVIWQMGDGHSVSCAGPGVAYDPSRSFASQLPPVCGYEYSTSSANQPGEVFVVTATVHFNATWTVSGAPGGGVLPAVDRSVALPVTVGEIQILNS